MSDTNKFPNLERLQEVLAAYGSQPEKWPANERAGLEKIFTREVLGNNALKLEYANARSVDQLLQEFAADDTFDISKSSASIMARIAIQKTRQADGAVVDLGAFKKSIKTLAEPTPVAAMPAQYSGRTGAWKMAALLAATFVFGIYIGVTHIAEPAAETVAEFTGNANSPTAEFTLFESGPGEFFEGEL